MLVKVGNTEQVNEGNILAGVGEYIKEYWGDGKLRKKALKIIRECEDDLSKIS